jgi:hypothetical protein
LVVDMSQASLDRGSSKGQSGQDSSGNELHFWLM